MVSRKRKLADQNAEIEHERKHLTKAQRERNVCKNRLDTLEQEESLTTEDRFTQVERERLLEAYDKLGFQAFQDMHLLQQFLPNRTERDLKGLMERLRVKLQQESTSESNDKMSELDGWSKLCQSLVGNFTRDKRVNLDNVLADSLMMVAEEREQSDRQSNPNEPNYPELLRNFSQLLQGKFPNNITPANARISHRLFEHITNLISTMNLNKLRLILESGSWLDASTERRRRKLEMAQLGLDELESKHKKCPSLKDLESENIEALCLELPKIKRIAELLNPLGIEESLLNDLIGL